MRTSTMIALWVLWGLLATSAGLACGSDSSDPPRAGSEHDHDAAVAEDPDHGHDHAIGAGDDHGHDHAVEAVDDHDHLHEMDADDSDHLHESCADDHDHLHEMDADDSDHLHESCADDHDHLHATVLPLDPVAAQNLGVRTEAVRPEVYYDQIKIPGMITVDPDMKYELSAPAKVRVTQLDARVPATVMPGERLAVLELVDGEIRDLQMRAVEVRAQHLADATERGRLTRYLESLQAAAQPSSAEIERVTEDLRIVEARLAAQESALNALLVALETAGLQAHQLEALAEEGTVTTQIELRVPEVPGIHSFEVIDRPVHTGQTVEPGGTLYELVSLERLWVMGEAFEADLAAVRHAAREDLPVCLVFPAEDRRVPDLRIVAIEGEQDGANRVTHFFVQLPNHRVDERIVDGHRYHQWAHRAGSRVQILVATQEVGRRYVIPSSALVRQAGQAWLFLHEGGEYLRVPVAVEDVGARHAVLPLDCGLHPGDQLVVRGALQLNLILEQQRGPQAVDPHAGHSH